MAAPRWKFMLANSTDLSLIGELTNATSKSLDLALNKPGTARFQLPLMDNMADEILEEVTCVLAYRNEVCIWSGPVWTVSESLPEDTLDIGCVGWFQELIEGRELHADVNYDNVDAGIIAFNLIDIANTQDPATPLRFTKGQAMPSQLRTRAYQQSSKIGPLIDELSTIEAGFDYSVDPITRQLNIYYNQIKPNTTLFGYGQDRPNAVFGLDWGPDNLQSLKRDSDTSKLRNRIFARGKFALVEADDYPSQIKYGVFEETINLNDVVEENILGAYANATVLFRKDPSLLISFVPVQFTNSTDNVPEPFVDYEVGDIVYVGANRGRIKIDHQAIRVFGMTINIDEEGNETAATIQTRYQ